VARRERDLPVGAHVEGPVAGRAGPLQVDRVHLDQPHALDRREVERGDDRHVSGAAAASGP